MVSSNAGPRSFWNNIRIALNDTLRRVKCSLGLDFEVPSPTGMSDDEEDDDVATSFTSVVAGPYPKLDRPFAITAPLCDLKATNADEVGAYLDDSSNDVIAFLDYYYLQRASDKKLNRGDLKNVNRNIFALQQYDEVRAVLIALPAVENPVDAQVDIIDLYVSEVSSQQWRIPIMFVCNENCVMALKRAEGQGTPCHIEIDVAQPELRAVITPLESLLRSPPPCTTKRVGNIATHSEWKRHKPQLFPVQDEDHDVDDVDEDQHEERRRSHELVAQLNEHNAILACQHKGVVPYTNAGGWQPDFEHVTCIFCSSELRGLKKSSNTLFTDSLNRHVNKCKKAWRKEHARRLTEDHTGTDDELWGHLRGKSGEFGHVKNIVDKAQTYTGPASISFEKTISGDLDKFPPPVS